MCEIKSADIRAWQNELIKQGYAQTYLKSINNQLVALFNYAVRYYDLRDNPCKKAGSIGKHLHEVDEECHERVELLVEQMKAGVGITEELKTTDQMRWGGLMNNEKSAAEEIVIKEIIFV